MQCYKEYLIRKKRFLKKLLIMEMIEIQTITQLLIEKGIITKEEYFAKLKEVQEQYEERQKNVVV
jgi:hypothetical protein